ncbi:MAG: hypothetical protein H7Z71_00825 [Moraxellaceae bacterium]|nr:hypothetical protein [Pseudobdellovibrionaceae bacterium]
MLNSGVAIDNAVKILFEEANEAWGKLMINNLDPSLPLSNGFEHELDPRIHRILIATPASDVYSKTEPPAEDQFRTNWFGMGPKRNIKYLGLDKELIDAGDYDQSGDSEFIFIKYTYHGSQEEYKLLDSNFEEVASRNLSPLSN